MSDPLPSPPATSTDSRRRRTLTGLGIVVALALAAFVAAAIAPGPHAANGGQGRAVAAVSHASRVREAVRETKVFDSRISAKRYGPEVAARENGVNAAGQPVSDLTPLAARSFSRPVAEYRAYAERWAARLGRAQTRLTTALRAGERGRAQAAWTVAFSDYLHLGAVYGLLPGTLDDRLAEVPGTLSATRFPGLHRLEKGLWTGERLRRLVPVSLAVSRAVGTLRRVLPALRITPLAYATRAHEILEDAQRDLMSGTAVPWSRAGVLGTEAGLVATDRVTATLVPLLDGRDNTLGDCRYWLARLGRVLRSVRRPGGRWPTLGELSSGQRERIDGTLAGTLSALSEVPGTLETSNVSIPSMSTGAGG